MSSSGLNCLMYFPKSGPISESETLDKLIFKTFCINGLLCFVILIDVCKGADQMHAA